MTKHSRRFALLTLMTLLAWQPETSAEELESSEITPLVDAGVCDEATLRLEIDKVNDVVYLRRPDGSLWKLDDHALKVGFGASLQRIMIEVDVKQTGNWWLWLLAPSAEEVSWVPSDSSGLTTFALMRPSSNTLVWELGADLSTTLQGIDPAIPIPDLVIEPQTGCPEDKNPM